MVIVGTGLGPILIVYTLQELTEEPVQLVVMTVIPYVMVVRVIVQIVTVFLSMEHPHLRGDVYQPILTDCPEVPATPLSFTAVLPQIALARRACP